jgi:uncharacterized surface protein with fasciclin (FAS1) repeats
MKKMVQKLPFAFAVALLLVLSACARPAPRLETPTPLGEAPAAGEGTPVAAASPGAEATPAEGGEAPMAPTPTAAAPATGQYAGIDPEQGANIMGTLANMGDFDRLIAALAETGLAGTLRTAGPYTLFAPTDAALANVSDEVLNNPDTLSNVLLYHVVPGELPASGLASVAEIRSSQGENITVQQNGTVLLNGTAGIVGPNVEASNGIIHVIDTALTPPSLTAPEATATPEGGAEAAPEGEAAPAEGEAAPAEGEAAPAEGEAAPAEGEAAPAEGEAEATPAEGGEMAEPTATPAQ